MTATFRLDPSVPKQLPALARRRGWRWAAIALATTLAGGAAHAQASTGSLAGWTVVGDAIAAGGRITLTTAFLDGAADQAGNLSGQSAADAGVVAAAAGVPIEALDLANEYATEGSLVVQHVVASAGQTVSFDWLFSSVDDLFVDRAFVVLGGQVTTLATTAQPGSGLGHYSATFAASGTQTLAFGIVDTGDYDGVSTLSVGNLQLGTAAPVPEPGTAVLLAAGLALLGGWSLRHQRRSQSIG